MSLSFTTIEELANWLRDEKVDCSSWGTGGSKTIADLWEELVSRECCLFPGPKRSVVVAVIIIEDGPRVLCEAGQEMSDGRFRERRSPPAEKKRGDESIRDTVLRCLGEELELAPNKFEIIRMQEEPPSKPEKSGAYPKLPTEYIKHYAQVSTRCLPTTDFDTNEIGKPPRRDRRHWWTWCNRHELDLPPLW